jgi:hypothetical protein
LWFTSTRRATKSSGWTCRHTAGSTTCSAIASHAGFLLETDTSLNGYAEFHAGYNDTNDSLGDTNTHVVTFVQTPSPSRAGC